MIGTKKVSIAQKKSCEENWEKILFTCEKKIRSKLANMHAEEGGGEGLFLNSCVFSFACSS